VDAVFDLIAPAVIDVIAFVVRFWPGMLLAAAMLVLARKGVRAPRLRHPPPALAYAIVCVLSLAATAVTLHRRGEPRMPGYEDDFGYLLSADTFLHGRLTNPPHPLTRHFETLYTQHQPTYSAIYLPGNGLMLAAGRLITGRAIAGMWVATALAAMAILWALRGWLSDGWAFALGCLVAVNPTMAAWSDSFHGGSLAACGGALIVGAVGRLRRAPRLIDGVAFGAGAALLELTRPYEGFVVAAAFFIVVVVSAPWRSLIKPMTAALLIAAAGAGGLMVLNRAVTGDPLKLPYVAYNDRYLSVPNFLWQRAGPNPTYEHPEFARLNRQFRNYYFRNRELREFPKTVYAETRALLDAAIPEVARLWLVELLPLGIFLIAAFRDRAAAALAAVLAAALASLLAITWFTQTHYAAPAAATFAIALGIGFMRLDAMRPAGKWLSGAAFVAMFIASIATILSWPPFGISERTRMIAAMAAKPGPHLVLVAEDCYGFLRNGAEIDRQRVIWARNLVDNDELLRRYADRSLWSLQCETASRLVFVRPALRPPAAQTYERDPYVP
jgi:hypothetical protein